MANRINRNLRWVKRQLDMAGVQGVLEEEILDAMSLAEIHVLEETNSVKDVSTITFDSTPPHDVGQYALPATAESVFYISTPAKWVKPMQVTNDAYVYESIKQSVASGTQPLVCMQRGSNLYFWPVPTNGDSVTVYSVAGPATPYSQAEGTGDPILSWDWDKHLRYAALAHLLPADNPWEKKAEDTFNKAAQLHIQDAAVPLLVDHSSRRLGF